jgi:CheY-like chemotaxis protein
MLRGKLELVSPLRHGRGASFSFSIPCTFATEAGAGAPCQEGHGAHTANVASAVAALAAGERSVPPPPQPQQKQQKQQQPQQQQQLLLPLPQAPVPAQLRVLLVEDDDLNVLVMQTSLQAGMKSEFGTDVLVTRAHTAEEALVLVGDVCAFDLIVVDQHMEPAGGVMKGSQLVEILGARHCAPGARRPVLCIASGNADVGSAETIAFLTAGASIVWGKPYPGTGRIVADIVQVFQRANL